MRKIKKRKKKQTTTGESSQSVSIVPSAKYSKVVNIEVIAKVVLILKKDKSSLNKHKRY